ncbi:pickpocket protein 19-like [Vanessa atalanta]|uniref:pickpocket protein 19-like n=1 Tax=Vanessa atalanta TaxID=42275 RepID=UPI001FCCDBBF|nr:pickpocket protein 19-like [Vanessa atalanta]
MRPRVISLILASIAIVNCIPPPHPAVVAVRQAESLLPPHLKSPALRNPHLLQALELTSLLHNGEKPVCDLLLMTQSIGLRAWNAFVTNPISFGVETTYTDWDTRLPTVAICELSNDDKIYNVSDTRQVTVRNIENDPLVVETTPHQRACRFHDENDNGLYPHYSYSACNVHCRKRAQMELCQCNDHFMLGTTESERCNISGMWCLHTHSSHLTTLKPDWAKRPGLSCDCMPSCDETEITIIKDVITSLRPKKKKTYVEMILAYLPTERFKRSVVRSQLDLVVSVGGTAGLFVGASLLSFVELIFFFTIRFISDLCMKKRKQIIPTYQN